MSYFDFPVQANGGMTVSGTLEVVGSVVASDLVIATASYAETASYLDLVEGPAITINKVGSGTYEISASVYTSIEGSGILIDESDNTYTINNAHTYANGGGMEITEPDPNLFLFAVTDTLQDVVGRGDQTTGFGVTGSISITASNTTPIIVDSVPNFATTASGLPVGAFYTSDTVRGPQSQYVLCVVRPTPPAGLYIVNNISGGSVNSVSTPLGGTVTLTTGTYPVTQGEAASGNTPTADGAGNSIQFNYSGPAGGTQTWSVVKNGVTVFSNVALTTSPYTGNLGGMTATSTDIISITFNS